MNLLRGRPGRSPLRRDEGGSVTVEFIAWTPWLIAIALVAWQLLLYAGAMTNAETAARNAARATAAGQGGSEVAVEAVPDWLSAHTVARRHPDGNCEGSGPESGNRVNVCIRVPLIAPWLSSDLLKVERSAEMPSP
ncbi:hypothetical protein FTX61_19275 [Nitriliruptoraceae bacterium ZYF776]|nr:hypothetical protein [Profundirhabdus halotolerans]